jgi:5-methylthioadenosine/S-adenosylhomocysteine deaminase
LDIAIDSKWIYFPKTQRLLKNGRIIVEGKKIIYSGPQKKNEAVVAGHDHFKFKNGIIIPGFVNAHTHLPETLLRGLCDDKDLQAWLYDVIWKVEPNLRSEDAYWGSLLGIADMLSSGTVGFNDQYFYSDQIAKAVSETGFKAIICPSIFFKGNPEANSIEESFIHAKDTFKKWHGYDQRIWVGFGPHAPYTVDPEWFERIAEEARKSKTTLHTHLNETQYEVENALKSWGMRPIEYMEKIGVLNAIGSAAHCVFLSDNEMNLLNQYDISVLHCPKSNLKIGAGVANVPALIKSNVNVCLGTDGQASNNKLDMIEEIALEVLIHKGVQNDPLLISSQEALKMATVNASALFPKSGYSGTLEKETRADITIIDFDSVFTTPVINPLSHLTYAISRQNVSLTIVDGEILYNKGVYPTLNLEVILDRCQKITEKLMMQAYGDNWESEKFVVE